MGRRKDIKPNMSTNDLLADITQTFRKMQEEQKAFFDSQRKMWNGGRRELTLMARKKEMLLKTVEKANKAHQQVLEHILKVNSAVEETLCNVLLAIRQNEYLQAWYPAQNGQPEKKVVGKYVSK